MSAAGACVVQERGNAASDILNRPVRTYEFDWTSTSGGAVSGIPSVDAAGDQVIISGYILRVVFIPNQGATQPDNDYNATLLDRNGIDVLNGQGASLANDANTTVMPGVLVAGSGLNSSIAPFAVDEQLTLTIDSAGDAATGTVLLYVR